MYALGNVKASQGRHVESFHLHQKALLQYKSVLGPTHRRTGDACYKVAQHLIRLGQYKTAG